ALQGSCPMSKYLIFLLTCLLPSVFIASGVAAQTVRLNSVTQVTPGSFLLGAPDPHIVYTFEQGIDTSGMGVHMAIELAAQAEIPATGEAAGQIFWATGSHGFEEKFSLKFPLNRGSNELFIPLGRLDDNITKLRIDVDGCECLLKVDGPHWRPDSDQQQAYFPESAIAFLDLKSGRDIPPANWVGVQFDSPAPGVFEFSGWDPRIVTTEDLNLPLNIAAGVYFDFNYNLPFEFHKFELFWKLDRLNWSQRRSAHFILPSNKVRQGEFKVFIPFKNIHSRQNLRALRLDFEACELCRLELRQARLIGYDEIEEYQPMVPERLYYVHTEKPPKEFLRKEINDKLSKDLAFFISWILLIIAALAAGLWLMFKSALVGDKA
ncbi:MAG: hypothetical protein KJP04_11545, partial [Arenicella sp.]|nr:hypothetical protein [Arenicella sp.]